VNWPNLSSGRPGAPKAPDSAANGGIALCGFYNRLLNLSDLNMLLNTAKALLFEKYKLNTD